MRFTIVHAADLHLDSPLLGLARYEGAPVAEVRAATRRALENLVSLCLEEDARLLLLAGDLYDGDWRDYSTGLYMASQFARLREVGTQVVWIRGNHDAQSRITRHLALGDHCFELSSRQPETRVFESLEVAVHGQGFATAAVVDDLSAHYPEPVTGVLNIGLLHTALSGVVGHAPYAPCDVSALAQRGYDYWALGHVHKREVVATEPWIVFPGNLQGRHVREPGAKGATVIRVREGAVQSVEHRSLDVVRFYQLAVDVTQASSVGDVAELARQVLARAVDGAEGRLVAARLALTGRSRAHASLMDDPERVLAEIRARAAEIQMGDAWIEQVRFATDAAVDLATLAERDDVVGELLRSLSQLSADPAAQAPFLRDLAEFARTLPPEVRAPGLGVDLEDPDQSRELFEQASRIIQARLLGDL